MVANNCDSSKAVVWYTLFYGKENMIRSLILKGASFCSLSHDIERGEKKSQSQYAFNKKAINIKVTFYPMLC
jgi:hypothetical protein